MSHWVHGQSFPNRRALARHCEAMLDRGALTSDEEAFVRALLDGHPRARTIIGPGVCRIVVGHNGFGDSAFVVVRTDGIRQPFAHLTCIERPVTSAA